MSNPLVAQTMNTATANRTMPGMGVGMGGGFQTSTAMGGLGVPSSTYHPSNDILAMISKGRVDTKDMQTRLAGLSLHPNNMVSQPYASVLAGGIPTAGQSDNEFIISKEDFPALGSRPKKGPQPTDQSKSILQDSDAILSSLQQQYQSSNPYMQNALSSQMIQQGAFPQPAQQMDSLQQQAAFSQGLHQRSVQDFRGGLHTDSDQQFAHILNQSQAFQSKPSGNMADRFGLLGLLSVIRMTDQDLNVLTLGFDLTTLGLNLNSPEYLYTTFASPWSEAPTRVQPEYKIPSCYQMQSLPPLKRAHFQKFTLETLFYIFYSMPRDVLQVAAAQELFIREWRYHKELKLWFTRVPNTEPTVKTNTYEKGSYYYFDVATWQKVQKDNFVLEYDKIEDGKMGIGSNLPSGGGGGGWSPMSSTSPAAAPAQGANHHHHQQQQQQAPQQ
eukprot:GEZU01023569.1.p1 GENE.GEZU01023569.1~~GEZU01023569.1.p1  ORF type:complete len:460 (-),score=69.94 GEZU01023569.1:86-1411(-)